MIESFSMYFEPSHEQRMIHVYLPPTYTENGNPCPVMYFFDGQDAFDEQQSYYGKAWHMHTFLDRWEKEMIIVGIQSSPESDRRISELCPYNLHPRVWEGLKGRGAVTIEWIIHKLKPYIDNRYRTFKDRTCTGLIGASIGALAGLHAVCAYNDVFSKAACLSTALNVCYAQILKQIEENSLHPDTRIYLSWGEDEAKNKDVLTHITIQNLTVTNAIIRCGARAYPYLQERRRHCEEDWSRQTAEFLRFLWLE